LRFFRRRRENRSTAALQQENPATAAEAGLFSQPADARLWTTRQRPGPLAAKAGVCRALRRHRHCTIGRCAPQAASGRRRPNSLALQLRPIPLHRPSAATAEASASVLSCVAHLARRLPACQAALGGCPLAAGPSRSLQVFLCCESCGLFWVFGRRGAACVAVDGDADSRLCL